MAAVVVDYLAVVVVAVVMAPVRAPVQVVER
jgi:hypothetical protein